MKWDIPYCSLILCLGFFFAIYSYCYSVKFTNPFIMNIIYTIVLSIFVLSSCTYSDTLMPTYNTGIVTQVVTGTVNTGTTYYTGTITQFITGAINTGGTMYQVPLAEDLSWSGDVYYPFFKWLETKTIRIKHQSWIPTKILFMNSEAKSIEVSIVFPSSDGANLRLSQIVMPSL